MNNIKLWWTLGFFISLTLSFLSILMIPEIGEDWLYICFSPWCIYIPMGIIIHYNEYAFAIKTPNRYKALLQTIEETEKHLIKAEGFGKGLEALEYKKTLQKVIAEKNELKAVINSYLQNYYSPYKEEIKSRLPKDWDKT